MPLGCLKFKGEGSETSSIFFPKKKLIIQFIFFSFNLLCISHSNLLLLLYRLKWISSHHIPKKDGETILIPVVCVKWQKYPCQVMGDRSGNIRWWDVKTKQSSSFNTHRESIRRIKFSLVVPGDRSHGRIVVLFNDYTFSVFDLVSKFFFFTK